MIPIFPINAEQNSISIFGNPNPVEYGSNTFTVNFQGELYNHGKIYWSVYEKNSSNKPSQLEILDTDTKSWIKVVQLGTFYPAGKTYVFEIKNGNIIEQFEFTVQNKSESPSEIIQSKTLTPFFDKCENDLWVGHFEDKETKERISFGTVFLYDQNGQRTKTTSLMPPEGYLKIYPNGNKDYPIVEFALLRVESYEDLTFSPVCPKISEPEYTLEETGNSPIVEELLPSTPLMITNEQDIDGTSIKSTNSYVDEYGYAHIIGEFVNNQDQTLNFVKFVATLYDRSGNVLDTEFTYSIIEIVHPYTKTPFEIIVSGNVEMIDSYEIQSSGSNTSPLNQKLELSPVRIFEDEYGYHRVVGEIFNTGDTTAHFVKIIMSFYDEKEEIVGIGWTYTTIDNIYPNGKSPFEIVVSDFVPTNGYSFQKPYESYSIFVQSQEYQMIYDLPAHVKNIQKEDQITASTTQETTQETIQNSSDSAGGCLIATATYGSELAPQVQQLRELRDNHLLQTESGSAFMNHFNEYYYSFSPIVADYERENPVFKEMVKVAITPMISSLSILNHVDMDSESSVLGYGISLIILNAMMYVGIPTLVVISLRRL